MTDEGEPFRFFWKSFTSASRADDCLLWELKRVLSVAGYQETPSRKPWRHISQNWNKWDAQLVSCGLEAGRMVPSRHALRKRPELDCDMLAKAEQEPVADTPGLLALVVTWPRARRSVEARSMMKAVAALFFRLTLDAESIAHLANRVMVRVWGLLHDALSGFPRRVKRRSPGSRAMHSCRASLCYTGLAQSSQLVVALEVAACVDRPPPPPPSSTP